MTREEINQIVGSMSADVHPEAIHIETDRLLLRPLTLEDLPDIHAICIQEDVAKFAGWQVSESLEMSENRLKEYISDGETVAVVLKENKKVIGTISLQKRPWHIYPIDRTLKGRELGFDLRREYWGRGLMPEAVKAINAFCFDTLGYDFLTAGHFQGNIQSKRAIEKCGFTFLFEDDRELPRGDKVHICTYIQYNPRKEIKNV